MDSGRLNIAIIIPCHNEQSFLRVCLDSFVNQTVLPNELIIVDDNSTDNTPIIAEEFSARYSWIRVVRKTSTNDHVPGKKVIDAFYFGLGHSKISYDLLGKFDADIILPKNYFERMTAHFGNNPRLGMCSGLLYIEQNEQWIYEPVANKSHIRGPIKLYTAQCFEKIGGLKHSIGWDTVDELIAQYHKFDVKTDSSLHVKHLRPTGKDYAKNKRLLQGEGLYKMRYGFALCFLASLKSAWNHRKPMILYYNLKGFLNAKRNQVDPIVSADEGKFIRQYRWKNIKNRLL